MEKKSLFILYLLFSAGLIFGQQNYDDFDGNKFQYFGPKNGDLDSIHNNPGSNSVNNTSKCAEYNRSDTVQHDNLKIYPYNKLVDVTPYATNAGTPPRFKMKLYTEAPVGTIVKLQLGIKSDDNFPSGIHSIYQAATTVQDEWEELIFTFIEIPVGSLVGPTNVDKIDLFFNPGSLNPPPSLNPDTYYFDDLTGPEISTVSMNPVSATNNFELKQNFPNPASGITTISYNLKSQGIVSLKLYNALGMEVSTLVDQKQSIGIYNVTVNAENISNGTYFYILQIGELIEVKKMLVCKL